MSPTLFRERGYRFYFFAQEETRIYIHHSDCKAKYWLEPSIELTQNFGLFARELREAEDLVRIHEEEIKDAWSKHFPG